MSVLRRRRRDEPRIEDRIERALAALRPLLRLDSVGIELVAFEAERGVAVLRFGGDCPDCEMSAGMLRQGIEAHLRMQVPEVREVRAVGESAGEAKLGDD
jgi:Fe-S cluster biogenesis protein NfuA